MEKIVEPIHRARWYDANVGRWISEDPLGFAAGDVNTARYVGNGVVGSLDPSGLQPPVPTSGPSKPDKRPREGRSGPIVWVEAPEEEDYEPDFTPEEIRQLREMLEREERPEELPRPDEKDSPPDVSPVDTPPTNDMDPSGLEEASDVPRAIEKIHAVEWIILIGPIVEFGAMTGATMAEVSEFVFHDAWLGDPANDRNEWVECQKKLNETWREEWNHLWR